MPLLQSGIRAGRAVVPRGWSPLLRTASRCFPHLRRYTAKMCDGSVLDLDLAQPMCLGLFFHGKQPHEPAAAKLIEHVLVSGSSFIDVGANVGYYTAMAAQRVGAEGAVVAVEPLPSALSLLRVNASRFTNVTIHAVAAGEHARIVNFYPNELGDRSSLLPDAGPTLGAIRVPMRPLDDLTMSLEHVDLVKIDVEGAELDVMRGARQLIARCQPVIYWEHVEAYTRRTNVGLEDYESLLRSITGGSYMITWADQTISPVLASSEPSGYLLAIPEARRELLDGSAG